VLSIKSDQKYNNLMYSGPSVIVDAAGKSSLEAFRVRHFA